MKITKILWPTDFSENAAKALPYVTSLTEKYQTEIHLLYVIEDLSYHGSWYGDFEKERVTQIQDWERKTAEQRLNEICEKYLNQCPLYLKHVAVGDPAREILKLIDSEGIDMVVMATHGRRGYFRFGGVTEKIVQNAGVPVVTIPVNQTL